MPHADDQEQPTRGAPYPYIYSKDPWDERRVMAPADHFAPAERRLPRAGIIVTWAILLAFAVLIVVSIAASVVGR